MSDRHYGYAGLSGQASAIGHYEHTVQDDWKTRARMAEAAEYNRYVRAAGNSVPVGMAGVAEFAALGGPAGALRQHVSDGRYELTVHKGRNAGLNTAGVANSVHGVTRQTDPTWADVRSVGLYSAGSCEQHSGITKVIMHSAYPGQYHQS